MALIKAGDVNHIKDTWLIYGGNGTGKSHLLGTVMQDERFHPYLVVNGDVSKTTFDARFPGLDVWEYEEGKKIGDQTTKMLSDVRRGQYKTVLFDNVTMFMNNYIYDVSGWNKPKWDDWDVLFRKTQAMIADLKRMSDILVVTALPVELTDEEGNVKDIHPYVTGKKFPQTFNSYFDTIMVLKHRFKRTKDGMVEERYLTGKKEDLEMARDRNGKVGRIDNPTLSKIYDTIKGVKN